MKTLQQWIRRITTRDMAVIACITLLASLIGAFLKQYPGFKLLGALIIALLIGMLVQFPVRRWWIGQSKERQQYTKDAAGLIANKFLRLGIILLGFKLNLTILFTQGIKCIPIAIFIVTFTIIVTYAIARALHVSPQLAILTAGGTGICGAAAVMGLSGSLPVDKAHESEKEENEVMAVATVAIMGTIFALIEIAIGPMLHFTQDQLGIMAGGSLHEIAHAVAAGAAFNAVDIATIMKLSRVLMLAPAAIIIGIWWSKRHAHTSGQGGKVVFPYFMLGFIAASIIGTYVPFVQGITGELVSIAYIVLGMAMAALGINVNFKAIAQRGRQTFLASFIASIILLIVVASIARIFF